MVFIDFHRLTCLPPNPGFGTAWWSRESHACTLTDLACYHDSLMEYSVRIGRESEDGNQQGGNEGHAGSDRENAS
jgi:hypothetical protein